MFNHLAVGANDLERSKRFYDAVFAAMGGPVGEPGVNGRLVYAHKGGRLMVTRPVNGEPATHANGGTIGFKMDSVEEVDAWHQAGVASGGTSIEDPPGFRPSGLYLAYLRDPDGNKLCAVHRPPA